MKVYVQFFLIKISFNLKFLIIKDLKTIPKIKAN